MDGYYRLYAYTDMSWATPQKRCFGQWQHVFGLGCLGQDPERRTSLRDAHHLRGRGPQYRCEGVVQLGQEASNQGHPRDSGPRRDPSEPKTWLATSPIRWSTAWPSTTAGTSEIVGRKVLVPDGTISPDNLMDIMNAMWRAASGKGASVSFPYQWVAPSRSRARSIAVGRTLRPFAATETCRGGSQPCGTTRRTDFHAVGGWGLLLCLVALGGALSLHEGAKAPRQEMPARTEQLPAAGPMQIAPSCIARASRRAGTPGDRGADPGADHDHASCSDRRGHGRKVGRVPRTRI